MDHIPQYLKLATDLAHKAGDIMLMHFESDLTVEMKDNTTPLTIADTTINEMVVSTIKHTYPTHKIIAEEGSDESGSSSLTWICDPIDGTIPYTVGFPTSLFCLGLYDGSTPVLGVQYDPYLKRLYTAVQGAHTQENGKDICVRPGGLQPGDVVGTINYGVYDYTRIVHELTLQNIRNEEVHCFAYLSAAVARGKLKGAILPPAMVWDRAASKVLIEGAGGRMTDEKGKDFDIYSEPKAVIVSNGDSHAQLVDLVQKYYLSHTWK